MFFKNIAFIGLIYVFCSSAFATTFYIDAENGNDSWSGQLQLASGSDGPWQSLAKVAAATLLPGDTVLLSCNQTWHETLKINQSGTVDAPISIGTYGDSCDSPPLISGLQQIPDYAWEPYKDGIWKAQLPVTLIKNGFLRDGKSNWRIWSTTNDAAISPSVDNCVAGKTAPCLTVNGGKSSGLLSSAPFAIKKGTSYQVKFSSLLSMKQLVPNGNLDAGTFRWHAWSPTGNIAIQPSTSSCLAEQVGPCLAVVNNTSAGLLTSETFPVVKDETYTLNFSAYTPSNKAIKAIVRQSSGSYTTLGLVSSSIIGSNSWQNYTYTFTATANENAARLDFEIPIASTIQIQKVSLKLSKTPIKAIVRQNSGTYQTLGLVASANNLDAQWKDSTFTFMATNSAPNARLDFEIPLNSKVQLQNIVLSKVEEPGVFSQLLDDEVPQTIAHHPNRGFDSTSPDSMFFKIATPSQTVVDASGKRGSNYFVTGSDFFLPANGSIGPGTHVTIRDSAWDLVDTDVSAITGTKVDITPKTNYPLSLKDLGYFFTGELWMLDSADEWYFDTTAQTLYYYPSGLVPGSNIQLAKSLTGADLKGKSNIQIDGINFDGVDLGIDVSGSANIVLNGLDIRNVKTNGVYATTTDSLTVQNSKFTHIGQQGVFTLNSTNANVSKNVFDQIGVILDSNSKIISLPIRSAGVVVVRKNAFVSQNSISNFGYVGINAITNSTIKNNYLKNGCLVLNDCGGIYVDFSSSGTKITGNIVDGMIGNVDGLPSPTFNPHAVGIYLDNKANSNIVEDNTVTNTVFGIQLHNAYNQQIKNNLLFGAKTYDLWVQESLNTTTATGDVHSLVVGGNKIFPTLPNSVLKLQSKKTSIEDFGSFDENIYSNYFTPKVASETYLTTKDYTLPQWQTATFNGTPRNLDINGKINAPLGNYTPGILQSNIVPNSNFQNGLFGWSKYASNGTAPSLTLTTCNPEQVSVACIKVNSSTVVGNLVTPTFNIKKDFNYFLSFDALSSDATQVVTALVRQAGPTYWNGVMSSPLIGTQGTNGWKRYSVIFKATDNALTNGSVPGVSGARIDFTGIKANQSLTIANLELVPLAQTPLTKSAKLIYNPLFTEQSFNCPSSDELLCSNYISFIDRTRVQWPITLPALGSTVIFSQSLDFPDADQDGIADSQDTCPNTVSGAGVNSKGCALLQ
ncbi:MAG: carbohydrate binding domain-containing protein [Methylococcaceae bacterium]|nr:carbohydrate binding domain-containing protein [Methylococcaceae bacterium]MDZ4155012.1 carbohydrate binding domain-containing protein [Methylococcales bacterium]MDP2394543.1 carbohydrate binding domain-containing protein [Methylococcaceae bacterium]MDP3021587.1 carbohydrate binding domain-containing protein [Methylococcaceae bacterium]MDP3392086.1 carbohydrate binding domain-containing protein [Methylococcaceae bacterium]